MPIQRSHIDDYTPDGRYANWLIEVFPGSSLRDLRLAVLQLAYRLSQEDAQDLRGMVVLVDSRIRPSSVNNEMRRLRAVLLPDLVDRLVIYNEADALALDRRRIELETALAVLVGEAPSGFTLAPTPWTTALPAVSQSIIPS